jgi:hypothetical protein
MDSRDIDPAAAPKATTPTRLEELQTEELLKKNIIGKSPAQPHTPVTHSCLDQAQVHYGPVLPIGSTFHVVTELDTMYDNEDMAHKKISKALLIVFPVLNNSTTWTCINANEAVSYSISNALEDLLHKLQGGCLPSAWV